MIRTHDLTVKEQSWWDAFRWMSLRPKKTGIQNKNGWLSSLLSCGAQPKLSIIHLGQKKPKWEKVISYFSQKSDGGHFPIFPIGEKVSPNLLQREEFQLLGFQLFFKIFFPREAFFSGLPLLTDFLLLAYLTWMDSTRQSYVKNHHARPLMCWISINKNVLYDSHWLVEL